MLGDILLKNITKIIVNNAQWDEENGIFYRAYNFFIYFNRNKRAVHYIGNNSVYSCYGFNSKNNMNSFMNSFQRDASKFLNEVS